MQRCEACGAPVAESADPSLCLDCLAAVGLTEQVARRTDLHRSGKDERAQGPRARGISDALEALDK